MTSKRTHRPGRLPVMTRRELLRRSAILGAAGSMGGLLAACGDDGGAGQGAPTTGTGTGTGNGTEQGAVTGALTPTFYNWILSLYPPIEEVSADFEGTSVDVQEAPVEGFGIERFVAEAREEESSWDVYVGMTPFVEMASLIEAGVVQPWDDHLPDGVLDAITPSVRDECTYEGALYNFPFLVDVICSSWNGELVEQAGLDPEAIPETWDELIAAAQEVVDSEAAPFGVTFDAHGWRSLAPIAHSIDLEVYREDGLFDFTHDAVVEALEIMKRMMELANPNVLDPGTADGGVNDTPDEGAFAGRQAAYYVKYGNAPIRLANNWPNPDMLRIAPLQRTPDGAGGTLFWTTGAGLFTFGENKDAAAEYLHHLATDERIWQQAMGTEPVGQLPGFDSVWEETQGADWLASWTALLQEQLANARSIPTTQFGVTQFTVGQPHWETYLTGEVSDPRAALQAAQEAVLAEIEAAAG